MIPASAGVVVFGSGPVPRRLRGLPTVALAAAADHRRVIVAGPAAELSAVLTALLRADRLDVEVAHATSNWSARRALRGAAQRVPLIRDETGTVIASRAEWRGADGALHGEAVVDDCVLFDGEVPGVRVEPTRNMPGLRAAVTGRGRLRWVAGRAAQLGTTGALLTRDGAAAPRPVRRSTFYRHTEGWLRVR